MRFADRRWVISLYFLLEVFLDRAAVVRTAIKGAEGFSQYSISEQVQLVHKRAIEICLKKVDRCRGVGRGFGSSFESFVIEILKEACGEH